MAGRTTDRNGTNLFLDDSNFATKYHVNRHVLNTVPKPKHTFFVCLVPTPEALQFAGMTEYNILDFIFAVKESDIPGVNVDIETLDQHNRKRLVQTKVNFDPISLTMYDDNSSKVQMLLDSYMSYHYASFRPNIITDAGPGRDTKQQHGSKYLTGSTEFQPGMYGYKPKDIPFFSRVSIFKLHSDKKISSWTCFNPLISRIKYDPVTYAADAEPSQINMTMEYEVMIPYDHNVSSENISSLANPDNQILASVLGAASALVEFYEVPPAGITNDTGILPRGLFTDIARELLDTRRYPGGISDAFELDNILDDVKAQTAGKVSSVLSSWGNFKLG